MTDSDPTDLEGGVIRWEDPPAMAPGARPPGPQRPWAIVAAQLRARPGQWALIGIDESHVVNRIRAGLGFWHPAGVYDAVQRTIDGKVHIYARYTGDPGPDV